MMAKSGDEDHLLREESKAGAPLHLSSSPSCHGDGGGSGGAADNLSRGRRGIDQERSQRKRRQQFRFSLGLVSGLVLSCSALALIFTFWPDVLPRLPFNVTSSLTSDEVELLGGSVGETVWAAEASEVEAAGFEAGRGEKPVVDVAGNGSPGINTSSKAAQTKTNILNFVKESEESVPRWFVDSLENLKHALTDDGNEADVGNSKVNQASKTADQGSFVNPASSDDGSFGHTNKQDGSILLDENAKDSRETYAESTTTIESSRSFALPQPGCQASAAVPLSDRFDCWPHYYMASEELCTARNCCWDPNPPPSSSRGPRSTPRCFYPLGYVSYSAEDVVVSPSPPQIQARLTMEGASPYPKNIAKLLLSVWFESQNTLRFKIVDANAPQGRYEVPLNLTSFPSDPLANGTADYQVRVQKRPFGILVTRKSTGETLFDSRAMAPLVFSDQFLQIGTRLSSPNVYGLGEHQTPLRLGADWNRLVMWARGQPPSEGGNLYGSHPFYLNVESDRKAHGVFLLNSNAMEVALQPYSNGIGALTFRTLGGVLDFYVFTGPSPAAVVEQYVSLVGKPALPPFWALGFHLSKFGVENTTELRDIIARNRAANIPYDVQWSDIDYMHDFLDWTVDFPRYEGLVEVVHNLHERGQRYVFNTDPSVSIEQDPVHYPPLDQGLSMDIFIKNASGKLLISEGPAGQVAHVDFFNPKADAYWFSMLQTFQKILPYDGVWLDMNEPSTFDDGSVIGCTESDIDNPYYVPPFLNGGTLSVRTLCPSALQGASQNPHYIHYNLHNLYGWSEARSTARGLGKLSGDSKRSFILSRSTFPSSGRFASHWLGDNRSQWPDLYNSIPAILKFNMYGVPMVGADVCGFDGDADRELCVRWMQLGAFYPFMRNHANNQTRAQDPAAWDTEALGYMRLALETRYRLLPFMYTRFFLSHQNGSPVVQPLFFLFENTETIDRQFMWGDELLISPALEKGSTSVKAYFPPGVWYDFLTLTPTSSSSSGQFQQLPTPLGKFNVHIRGGAILPVAKPANTTDYLRKQPFDLIVAPNENSTAEGLLYWDDGISMDSIEKKDYSLVQFQLNGSMLQNNVLTGNYKVGVQNFFILGIGKRPRNLSLNGRSITYFYDADKQTLEVRTLGIDVCKPFTIYWSY